MGLSSKWFEPFKTADEKEGFKRLLVNDRVVLERLYAIIEDYEEELNKTELSINEYTNPAFPYLKADRIGERRGLRKVKQLLTFLKD